MGEKTTETKPKDATFGDILTGNSDENGSETHNGEVVTETTTTSDDDENEDDD
jgi:hypothetical protein